MLKGITYALVACLIWGLIFIVPQFMPTYSCFEVALGRYFVYGLISTAIFFKSGLQGLPRYSRTIWGKAVIFSFFVTVGYYIFFVLSLRFANPAITALILGIAPITIAFYGNWQQKEISYARLIPPTLLILAGLLVINLPQLMANSSPATYLLGLSFALLALAFWTWYVVANSHFLKINPQVSSNNWSTLIGVATLFWVFLLGVVLMIFSPGSLVLKLTTFTPSTISFLIGSVILGVFCSWVGGALWNRASLLLPVSLAGQLMIFETLFGLLFVYILENRLPSLSEAAGMILLLGGVLYGIYSFSTKPAISKEL
jgi:drug/metabolite transporter (DMT)-like permease